MGLSSGSFIWTDWETNAGRAGTRISFSTPTSDSTYVTATVECWVQTVKDGRNINSLLWQAWRTGDEAGFQQIFKQNYKPGSGGSGNVDILVDTFTINIPIVYGMTTSVTGNASIWAKSSSPGTTIYGTWDAPARPYPVHSAVISPETVVAGNSIGFTINKGSSPYGTRVRVNGPGVSNSIVVATTTSSSFSWTVPLAYANYITSAPSAVYTVSVDTMDGATQLNTATYYITVVVPDTPTYNPTATIAVSEAITAINAITSGAVFVAGKSTLRVTAGGSAGQSATVTKREVIVGGLFTYDATASPFQKDFVAVSPSLGSIIVRTTDSRGRVQDSLAVTPIIRAYTAPAINSFYFERCNSSGTPAEDGTYIRLNLNVAAVTVKAANGTTELNQMGYTVAATPVAGSNPLTSKAQSSTLTDTKTNVVLGGGNFNTNMSYDIALTLNDRFTTGIVNTQNLATELVPLSIGTKGIAIGKIYNDSTLALDVVGKVAIGTDIALNSDGTGKIPGKIITSYEIGASQNLNNYTQPGNYFCRQNSNASTGTNYPIQLAGLLEVSQDPQSTPDFIYQRYTVYGGNGAKEGANGSIWNRQRYNGDWTDWTCSHFLKKGGLQFYWPYNTFLQNNTWNPITGVPVNPDMSWGDFSWRYSPSDASALFCIKGIYRVDINLSFARSGDSTGIYYGGVVPIATNGWIRPVYYGLPQPHQRMMGAIQTHVGIYGIWSVDEGYPINVTTTAIGVSMAVERIYPIW